MLRVTALLADVAGTSVDHVVPLARQLCVALHGMATIAVDCEPGPTFVETYVESILEGICAPVFGRAVSPPSWPRGPLGE